MNGTLLFFLFAIAALFSATIFGFGFRNQQFQQERKLLFGERIQSTPLFIICTKTILE